MKRLLPLLLLALAFLAPDTARAATCTWGGGAGNWDNTNTASWSCGHVPIAGTDTVVFDGTSGSGTIVVCGASSANCPNGAGVVSVVSITFGACTCTLDFATNNPNVTITTLFSGTGTATRTLSMGNGVWTWGGGLSASWTFATTTNLTLNINSSSIVMVGASTASSMQSGGLTWGALTISANSSNPHSLYQIDSGSNVSPTFASLTINAPATLVLRSGRTVTFTNGMTVSGASVSSAPVFINNDGLSSSGTTISVGATSNISGLFFRGITGAGSAINATNSYNIASAGVGLGTLSITNPSAGGGGRCIGC